MRALVIAASLLYSTLATSSVRAADGVIEINQVRAEAGGVTPLDTPGFPVTISQPGSYRLTSNLDVRGTGNPENTTAIEVAVLGVWLDLGGFAILGPVGCTWTPGDPPTTTCAPAGGTGFGVLGATRVENGTVMGMGGGGVNALNARDVVAIDNGGTGISALSVVGSQALRNGGNGISASDGLAVDCHVSLNGGDGLSAKLARGIVSLDNHGTGLIGSGGSVLESYAKGNDVGANADLILHSYALDNASFGISIPIVGAFGWNALVGNNAGGAQVQGVGALELGENLCGLDAICP